MPHVPFAAPLGGIDSYGLTAHVQSELADSIEPVLHAPSERSAAIRVLSRHIRGLLGPATRVPVGTRCQEFFETGVIVPRPGSHAGSSHLHDRAHG
jgi:hypothetical protein